MKEIAEAGAEMARSLAGRISPAAKGGEGNAAGGEGNEGNAGNAAGGEAATPQAAKGGEGPLMVLNERQQEFLRQALEACKVADRRVQEIISLLQPDGANRFDPNTMAFYSVTEEEP